MEIKGISTLEWWLTKWLRDHDFKGLKARVAADFQYDNDEGTIYFALAVTDKQDEEFLKFCQEAFDFPFDCDNFILSFFHEVGHAETWEWFTDEEWDKYFDFKQALDNSTYDLRRYFHLEPEYEASEWGCNYIVSHQNEIEEFWRVCQKLIFNIYKQNNVEVD